MIWKIIFWGRIVWSILSMGRAVRHSEYLWWLLNVLNMRWFWVLNWTFYGLFSRESYKIYQFVSNELFTYVRRCYTLRFKSVHRITGKLLWTWPRKFGRIANVNILVLFLSYKILFKHMWQEFFSTNVVCFLVVVSDRLIYMHLPEASG